MTEPQSTIPYASPRPERHNSVAGGIALMLMSLGLIVLGGCFLIGILTLYSKDTIESTPVYWPVALQVLPWVLYILAFACFGGALWMILAGVRWLYRVG